MEILIAKTAGFCFGVNRALKMAEAALENKNTPLYSLGPLIHNPRVVSELAAKGIQVVKDIDEIPSSGEHARARVIIRSHGVGPNVYAKASLKNLEIIDATCPFVKNVQQLAIFLYEQEYQVAIFGEPEHAEVKGVLDSIYGKACVISDPDNLSIQIEPKVGLISQTTQEIDNFAKLVAALTPQVKELRVFNTICLATSERQQEAAALSKKVDLMIIVGGKNSANTSRLVEVSKSHGTLTYQVESADEVLADWLKNIEKVGITAGASTPGEQITEVIEKIKYLGGKV